MLTRLAWKNIGRHPARSGFFIAATLLGLATALVAIHLMRAIARQRLDDAITIQTSHLQMHRRGFTDDKELSLSIPAADALQQVLARTPGVAAVSRHLVVSATVASPENSLVVEVRGVNPAEEVRTSSLHQYLEAGTYFRGTLKNPLLLSRRAAHRLGVGVGQKVVLTLKDARGDIVGGLFRVAGLFETANGNFDDGVFFVRYPDLAALTQTAQAHELTIALTDPDALPAVQARLAAQVPAGLELLPWPKLLPELASFTTFITAVTTLFSLVVLLGLSFGLLNTMNMVVQERTREIGMLRALGQSRGSVFRLLLLEAGLMTLAGAVGGIGLGVGLVAVLSRTGISFGEGLLALGIRSRLYPQLDPALLPLLLLLTLGLTTLIAVFPALRALRLRIAPALRA